MPGIAIQPSPNIRRRYEIQIKPHVQIKLTEIIEST